MKFFINDKKEIEKIKRLQESSVEVSYARDEVKADWCDVNDQCMQL